MALTLADIPVGTKVRIIAGEDTGHHCFPHGSIVTVTSIAAYDFTAENEAGEMQYLDLSQIALLDLSNITDLAEYKRQAVRALMRAKRENKWCGVAEELARQVGVGDLLPTMVEVRVTQRVSVERWPEDNDEAVTRSARSIVRTPQARFVSADLS